MRVVGLTASVLMLALFWLTLLVATGFNVALVGAGLLVVLSISGSSFART